MFLVHRIMNLQHGPAGLQVGLYIKKKCTRWVYTIDTVQLGYGSVCQNSTFVQLLLVYQLSLTRILMVNILLRGLKSFNTIYNIIYIYIYIHICMQIEHFHIHAIFLCKFVS